MMDLASVVTDLFEQYRSFNQNHPVIGSIATASVIFPAADITSQAISNRKVDWDKVLYTTGLSIPYGVYAYLSVRSGDLVEKLISPNPLAKAALGPNLVGHLFNLLFFANNAVGQKREYSLRALGSYYRGLVSGTEEFLAYIPKREYLNSVIGTITFWNAFQYVNYSYIPKEMQTPSTLAAAFGWTVLLSFWSLMGQKKNRRDRLNNNS